MLTTRTSDNWSVITRSQKKCWLLCSVCSYILINTSWLVTCWLVEYSSFPGPLSQSPLSHKMVYWILITYILIRIPRWARNPLSDKTWCTLTLVRFILISLIWVSRWAPEPTGQCDSHVRVLITIYILLLQRHNFEHDSLTFVILACQGRAVMTYSSKFYLPVL